MTLSEENGVKQNDFTPKTINTRKNQHHLPNVGIKLLEQTSGLQLPKTRVFRFSACVQRRMEEIAFP
jgi:hypothetical protein